MLDNRSETTTLIYRLSFAFVSAALALFLSLQMWDVTHDIPFMFFFAAIAISAWQGGLLPGLICAATSILLVDFFLIEPRFEIFTSPANLLQFVLFGLVAGLISWLEEQRHVTERSLRDVKDELEVILNGVSEGITVQDAAGRVVFANTAAMGLVGFRSTQNIVNIPISQLQQPFKLLDEEEVTITYDALPRHKVFATGRPAELTFARVSRVTGEQTWLTLKSAPIFDKNGRVRLAVNIFHDVTEKRQIEKQRLENEQRLRKVLDNLAAFVGVMRPDGTLIEANRSALEAANLKLEEVINKPFDQTYWWSYDESIQAQLRQAIQRAAAGETVRYDVTVRLASNRYITIDFLLAPVFNDSGQVEYLIPSGIDVTARNDLTNQLRIQQHRLETILNSIPGVVYEASGMESAGDQRMDYISQYAETMLGYPITTWKDSRNLWKEIVHPEDWEDTVRQADFTYRTGTPGPVPFRCVTADGRIIHAEAYNGVITDLNGQRLGTCGIVLDVTERRRQEAEIKRLNALINHERQRLTTIIGNVPGIVYEGSGSPQEGQQRMDYISAYVEKMLGYSPDEWQKDPMFWQKIMVSEDWDRTVRETSDIFHSGQAAGQSSGQPGVVQFRCHASDGRIVHIEAHSSVICDHRGEPIGATGVMMDITERRLVEEAVAQYAEDLRRSNAELEQFAYIASHDLQEPLRMVTSYLQLIEQRYTDQLDTDAREFIGYAVDGATRMKALINDLLAYSRVQRSRAEPAAVNMEAVLEQVLYNLQLSIEDTGAIITHDPLPELTASRVQMTQLFQNLIGNALKFRADRPPAIHIGVTRERQFWHFTITDNGIGIESDYLDRIFVIFQRLHARKEYPGTGIGLAICKKIIDKHGGRIYAESTPGTGTTFHFTLPAHRKLRRTGSGIH